MSKLSKKDLKGHDPVWTASASAFTWLRNQWTVFLLITFLGLGLLIGGAIYVQLTRTQEAKAQHALGKAMGEFQQWKLADEKTKVEATKKLEEKLKELDTQFPESKARQLSGLLRGQIAIEQKKFDEAKKFYEEFEKALPRRRKSLAWYPLAILHEDLKQSEQARELFKRVVDSKDPTYRKWALLGEGRTSRELNKNDEAKKTYEKFLEEFPKAPEVPMVRGLVARLATK